MAIIGNRLRIEYIDDTVDEVTITVAGAIPFEEARKLSLFQLFSEERLSYTGLAWLAWYCLQASGRHGLKLFPSWSPTVRDIEMIPSTETPGKGENA